MATFQVFNIVVVKASSCCVTFLHLGAPPIVTKNECSASASLVARSTESNLHAHFAAKIRPPSLISTFPMTLRALGDITSAISAPPPRPSMHAYAPPISRETFFGGGSMYSMKAGPPTELREGVQKRCLPLMQRGPLLFPFLFYPLM